MIGRGWIVNNKIFSEKGATGKGREGVPFEKNFFLNLFPKAFKILFEPLRRIAWRKRRLR